MSEKYSPKRGDRVRVVLEGDVSSAARDYFELSDKTPERDAWCSTYVRPEADYFVSVEKIDPFVTTFKPGDVVRNKVTGLCYSLGENGYLSHATGFFHRYTSHVFTTASYWTSYKYELVDLGR